MILLFINVSKKMSNPEQLTLETAKTWTLVALKDFVRKRGLPVSGSKKVLAARAYFAWELQLAVLPTAEEVARQKREHVQQLLKTPDGDMPHPDSLTTGWVDEDQGMALWPPTMIQDIAVILDRQTLTHKRTFVCGKITF